MSLITKLDSSVSNSNLLKLDEFLVERTPVSNEPVYFRSSSGTKIRIIGNGQMYSDSTKTTSLGQSFTFTSNNESVYFSDDVTKIAVSSKYGISNFRVLGGDARNFKTRYDFKYDSALNYLRLLYTADLDIKELSNKEYLQNIQIYGSGAIGNIGELVGIPELYELACSYTGVVGTLSEIGSISKMLITVALTGSSGITGTVNDFGDAQLAIGRSSGSCIVRLPENVQNTITFSSGSYVIS
jgi:hypothetical protein